MSLSKDLRADPVTLVDREGTSIAGEELRSETRCRGGYQRIVGGASGNTLVGQLQNEAPVIRGIQSQERVGKARREKIANDRAGRAMRRRQAREDGVGFERAMLDEAKPAVQRTSSGFIAFVPGRKCRDDETGVGCLQRRTPSSVSRTCSALSGGKYAVGRPNTPLAGFFHCLWVLGISIPGPAVPAPPSPARPGFRGTGP